MTVIENEGSRFYKHRDVYLPSVTTVLSVVNNDSFNELRGYFGNDRFQSVMDTAADLGKKVHKLGESHANGEFISHPDGKVLALGNSYAKWFDENVEEVISVEAPLVSEEHGFGGTADLICKIKGKLTAVDIKTSSKMNDSMGLQLAGLRILVEEALALKVEKTLIVRLKKNDPTKPPQVKEFSGGRDAFLAALELYKYLKSGDIPKVE